MSKRIVICSDGTWNSKDSEHPTNVVKMTRAVKGKGTDGKEQIVHYDPGVGTGGSWWDRVFGGAFGDGLEQNVLDAYVNLMDTYESGDDVFFFGFSRGAYTVRSTIGMIRNAGLLKPEHKDKLEAAYQLYRSQHDDDHPDGKNAEKFREGVTQDMKSIHFLGVWDTVGSRGIPLRWFELLTRRKYQFHDVTLSGMVDHAYQALAIDEMRRPFRPSVWTGSPKGKQKVEQVWLAGAHSDVGGGYPETNLADIGFMWMVEKAKACGLEFDSDYIEHTFKPDALGKLHDSREGFYEWMVPHIRPIGTRNSSTESLHASVQDRYANDQAYRPKNLVKFMQNRSR